MLYGAGLYKDRHPEIKAAERPLTDAFLDCVRALSDRADDSPEDLAAAIEATVHGHTVLLLDGDYGRGNVAIALAAERAARVTLALVKSLHVLSRPSGPPLPDHSHSARPTT